MLVFVGFPLLIRREHLVAVGAIEIASAVHLYQVFLVNNFVFFVFFVRIFPTFLPIQSFRLFPHLRQFRQFLSQLIHVRRMRFHLVSFEVRHVHVALITLDRDVRFRRVERLPMFVQVRYEDVARATFHQFRLVLEPPMMLQVANKVTAFTAFLYSYVIVPSAERM